MNKNTQAQNGYLLIELLVAMAIGIMILQSLVPILRQSRLQLTQQIQSMDRIALKSAIVDHFQAQLAPILWQACKAIEQAKNDESPQQFHLGKAEDSNLPIRINNKQPLLETDWLLALATGDCRYSTQLTQLSVEIPLSDCDWQRKESVVFQNCQHHYQGQVIQQSNSHTRLQFTNTELIGQSGIVSQQIPYFWYVAPSTSNQSIGAFWRMGATKGRALELWFGVDKLALYPLLDINTDGQVDTLAAHYGAFPMRQLKGLWLELIVHDMACNPQAKPEPKQRYHTHRGKTWLYDRTCAFPMQFVVGV